MKYCSKCGSKLKDNSKFCGQCGHQLENLNKREEAQTEKTLIEIHEKTKKTNLTDFKKIIRIGIVSICVFFIFLVAFFGINGSGIPTVVDIYKYEKFKNDGYCRLNWSNVFY